LPPSIDPNDASANNEEENMSPTQVDISEDLHITSDEEEQVTQTKSTAIAKSDPETFTTIKSRKRKVPKLRTLAAIAIGEPVNNIQFSQMSTAIKTLIAKSMKLLARALKTHGGEHHMPNLYNKQVDLIAPYKEEKQGKGYIVAPKETRFLDRKSVV
jgi:hypothetical protein